MGATDFYDAVPLLGFVQQIMLHRRQCGQQMAAGFQRGGDMQGGWEAIVR